MSDDVVAFANHNSNHNTNKSILLYLGRVTYVLDKNGVCTSVYDNLGDAASHIDAAKDALEEMRPAKSAGFEFKLPF